jgi:hypothetical protein
LAGPPSWICLTVTSAYRDQWIGPGSAQPDEGQNGENDNNDADDPKNIVHFYSSYRFVS